MTPRWVFAIGMGLVAGGCYLVGVGLTMEMMARGKV